MGKLYAGKVTAEKYDKVVFWKRLTGKGKSGYDACKPYHSSCMFVISNLADANPRSHLDGVKIHSCNGKGEDNDDWAFCAKTTDPDMYK